MDYRLWIVLIFAGLAAVGGVGAGAAAVGYWVGQTRLRERMADKAEIKHLQGVIAEMRQTMNESGYLEFQAWQAERKARQARSRK